MTLVDPFVPVKKSNALPGLVNNVPRLRAEAPPVQRPVITPAQAERLRKPAVIQPRPTIMQPQAPVRRPESRSSSTAESPSPITKQQAVPTNQSQAQPSKKIPRLRLNLGTKTGLLLAVGGTIACGLLIQSLIFGQILILVYAAFALVKRLPSHITLTIASVLIIGIIILMALNPVSPLINTFAVYAFLLLAVGVISLIREIYRQKRGALNT